MLKETTKGFLTEASKAQLEEIKWLIEHPEYEERPVDIETFVNNTEYLGLKFTIVGNRGFGCRPRILKVLKDIFDDGKKYEEFVLNCGIGWGKDFTSSIVLCYQLYRLACLKDPQSFFGLSKGSSIHLMLMSINEEHARDVLFGEVRARIDNSSWFKRKFFYNKKILTYLQFPKNIFLIPGNSKDTTFVGYNIFTAIIDEGDDYTITKTRDDAIEGYNAIKDRIVSRFRDKGLLGMIGSPKTVEGFMMNMYNNVQGISNRYRIWVSTWDSLLDTGLLSGESFFYKDLEIPVEYQERFKSDPERALRDLGGRPSYAKQPFITLVERIDEMFSDKVNIVFDFKDDNVNSFARFKESISGDESYEYYGHLDLAVNRKRGDRLGFSVGHVSGWKRVDSEDKPIITIDIAMVITSPPGGEIVFEEVKQMIYYLVEKKFNFKKITADSWNSIDMLQSLRNRGIFSEVLSVDKTTEPYERFKQTMYESRIMCHKYQLLADELKRLELVNGEKVDHPDNFSKDCADAVCGVVYNICKSNTSKIFAFSPSFGVKREFQSKI
jgi:hypothetical protein